MVTLTRVFYFLIFIGFVISARRKSRKKPPKVTSITCRDGFETLVYNKTLQQFDIEVKPGIKVDSSKLKTRKGVKIGKNDEIWLTNPSGPFILDFIKFTIKLAASVTVTEIVGNSPINSVVIQSANPKKWQFVYKTASNSTLDAIVFDIMPVAGKSKVSLAEGALCAKSADDVCAPLKQIRPNDFHMSSTSLGMTFDDVLSGSEAVEIGKDEQINIVLDTYDSAFFLHELEFTVYKAESVIVAFYDENAFPLIANPEKVNVDAMSQVTLSDIQTTPVNEVFYVLVKYQSSADVRFENFRIVGCYNNKKRKCPKAAPIRSLCDDLGWQAKMSPDSAQISKKRKSSQPTTAIPARGLLFGSGLSIVLNGRSKIVVTTHIYSITLISMSFNVDKPIKYVVRAPSFVAEGTSHDIFNSSLVIVPIPAVGLPNITRVEITLLPLGKESVRVWDILLKGCKERKICPPNEYSVLLDFIYREYFAMNKYFDLDPSGDENELDDTLKGSGKSTTIESGEKIGIAPKGNGKCTNGGCKFRVDFLSFTIQGADDVIIEFEGVEISLKVDTPGGYPKDVNISKGDDLPLNGLPGVTSITITPRSKKATPIELSNVFMQGCRNLGPIKSMCKGGLNRFQEENPVSLKDFSIQIIPNKRNNNPSDLLNNKLELTINDEVILTRGGLFKMKKIELSFKKAEVVTITLKSAVHEVYKEFVLPEVQNPQDWTSLSVDAEKIFGRYNKDLTKVTIKVEPVEDEVIAVMKATATGCGMNG